MSAFLDWQGSKHKTYSEIIDSFPVTFKNYYEPFLGGGSVFFGLFGKQRIFHKAYLSDKNGRLIDCYKSVMENPERVKKIVLNCCERNSEQYYYEMRKLADNPSILIYLMRASAVGYSEDEEGNFNAPWRKLDFEIMKRKIMKDTTQIDVASRYMNRWVGDIKKLKWEQALTSVNSGDVVYLDPPDRFEQTTYLHNYCKQLKLKGVHVFRSEKDYLHVY